MGYCGPDARAARRRGFAPGREKRHARLENRQTPRIVPFCNRQGSRRTGAKERYSASCGCALPIQPRRFFDLLQHRILEAGYGFLLTARLDGVPLASAVFLVWNGVLIYKYGASDERLWQHRANNLVLWSAIKWGCETGCRTFDLGRTDLEDTGLRSFKDGWGATEEPLLHSGSGPSMGDRTRPMVQRVLSLIIRRSHPWLSRALGELLYKYAA